MLRAFRASQRLSYVFFSADGSDVDKLLPGALGTRFSRYSLLAGVESGISIRPGAQKPDPQHPKHELLVVVC